MTLAQQITQYARKIYKITDKDKGKHINVSHQIVAIMVMSNISPNLSASEIDKKLEMKMGGNGVIALRRRRGQSHLGGSKMYSFIFESVKCGANHGFCYQIIDIVRNAALTMNVDEMEKQDAIDIVSGVHEGVNTSNKILAAMTVYMKKERMSGKEIVRLLNLNIPRQSKKGLDYAATLQHKDEYLRSIDNVVLDMTTRMKNANQL